MNFGTLDETARGHLAMLLFSALVAGSFPLGALAANDLPPVVLNGIRFALATAIVGTIALSTTGIPRSAARAPWRYLLLGGLFAIYFVAMFEGLKTAPPVSAAAVFTLTPVLAAGFGWLFLRQVTTSWTAIALALGATGALWVIFRGNLAALSDVRVGRGEAIYFVGCVAHAAYTPLVRKLNRGEPAIVFTFGMLVAGTTILVPLGLPAMSDTDWVALPVIVWVTIGYTAVFASAATFVLLQYATLRLPSGKVMAYTYLVPGWVALWQVALTGSWPEATVLGGFVLTTLAILLLLKKKKSVTP